MVGGKQLQTIGDNEQIKEESKWGLGTGRAGPPASLWTLPLGEACEGWRSDRPNPLCSLLPTATSGAW